MRHASFKKKHPFTRFAGRACVRSHTCLPTPGVNGYNYDATLNDNMHASKYAVLHTTIPVPVPQHKILALCLPCGICHALLYLIHTLTSVIRLLTHVVHNDRHTLPVNKINNYII